jgi:hypothetical protein
MSVKRFNDDKDKIFDTAERQLLKGFSGINDTIYELIMDIVGRLDSQGGQLVINPNNTAIASQLDDLVRAAVNESGYTSNVNQYLTNFEKVSKVDAEFHASFNNLSGVSSLITNVQELAVQQTVKNLTSQGLNKAFVEPVTDNLQSYILNGLTREEVANNLKLFVKGGVNERGDNVLGLLERHTSQVARDSIMQYDGTLQQNIQKEYQLNAVSYQGSLITDSRAQCRRWVDAGAIFTSDLENEIAWAYANGSGMIPGTTKNNFLEFRGGYNCRHTATPINLAL